MLSAPDTQERSSFAPGNAWPLRLFLFPARLGTKSRETGR